ncbi:MAG TPA: phospho-N-acetylmuramoyl-pentapeptide-transferase [Spirochaetota bacterium]|nr:phospho-N-acetylmuramoyl-pentapeptide-transferase [Spirochaetota bacterium]HOH36419.1 phospho-N-acetylmuramoyl-pentapeptide-transferase [Spirochaetota bacterium]HPJ14504.1 phospho-N-acetylmuramoyl-pentapeptide-transferase [Spirochaetota bacterium]HPM34212.1 phospho-N-acetylmuramoyl-pentapeptide-transferase [Spirochaetota bacterium]HPW51753.1 phospho-N-acetylmuramoyl-pentapeptide-transferase [Spirochaetota bacterium]
MFYHLVLPLQEYVSSFRIFQYITFRSALAALTALLFTLIFGKFIIRFLANLKFREEIRSLGPESHQKKAGTPTMGGIMILLSVFTAAVFWGNFKNHYFVTALLGLLSLGILGFVDDYIKSVLKKKEGLPARIKFLFQVLISFIVALVIYLYPSSPSQVTSVYVPFMNGQLFDFANVSIFGMNMNLTWLWFVFVVLVINGSSNAVNLTDGLDGLATGSVIIVGSVFGVIAYLTGHAVNAAYLRIPYVPASAELTVLLSALLGAGLGFLWFNANPAQIFMGDTGSLALGGIIGIVAVMTKKELFLFIVGGVFVAEALSVILQVGSFKLRKKRIFKMAPLHHHFELSGVPEQKIVTRMWIAGIILAIIGLSTLKIL